jgi:phage terminase large subunit-like protein
MVSGGRYEGPGGSPDRADAMVWAKIALMAGGGPTPRVHLL